MKVFILKTAKEDLREIYMRLLEFGKSITLQFRQSFEKFCVLVTQTPLMYEQYTHDLKYRKAVIAFDYLIFYQVDVEKEVVMIYRALHGKRNIERLI